MPQTDTTTTLSIDTLPSVRRNHSVSRARFLVSGGARSARIAADGQTPIGSELAPTVPTRTGTYPSFSPIFK
jgi:hypothetical protein